MASTKCFSFAHRRLSAHPVGSAYVVRRLNARLERATPPWLPYLSSFSYYEALAKAGIRLYRYTAGFLGVSSSACSSRRDIRTTGSEST
jgi:hypothetical protein